MNKRKSPATLTKKTLNGNRVFERIYEAPRALEFKSKINLLDKANPITSRQKLVNQQFRAEGEADADGNLGKPNHWEGPLEPHNDPKKQIWWNNEDAEKAKAIKAKANKPKFQLGCPDQIKPVGPGSREECKSCKACAIAR